MEIGNTTENRDTRSENCRNTRDDIYLMAEICLRKMKRWKNGEEPSSFIYFFFFYNFIVYSIVDEE